MTFHQFLFFLCSICIATSHSQQTIDTLTLKKCLEYSLINNPQLLSLSGSSRIGRAHYLTARSELLPRINGTGQVQINKNTGTSLTSTNTIIGASISGDQLLYDFGKAHHKKNASQLLWNALQADSQGSVQNILLNATTVYYTFLKAHALEKVLSTALEQARAHQRQAQMLLDVGKGIRYNVVKAQVDFANAQLSLSMNKNLIETSRLQLSQLMGITLSPTLTLAESLFVVPLKSISVDSAVTCAIKSRRDLQAVKLRVSACEISLSNAKKAYYPSLVATGSLGYRTNDFSSTVKNSLWSIGATFNFPLYQGNSFNATQEIAQANLIIAQSTETTVLRSILLDIEQQVIAVNEALQRIDISMIAIEQAGLALLLAKDRFSEGNGSALEMTDAELTYENAHKGRIQATYDFLIAHAKLQRAMGVLGADVFDNT